MRRDIVFASIRRSLGVDGMDKERRAGVGERLAGHPRGIVPARGQGSADTKRDLFVRMMEAAAGTIDTVAHADEVPAAVAAFLRRHNLPMNVRHGADARLVSMPWQRESAIEVSIGPSDGNQPVGLSHAFAAVAETGTVVLTSGQDNPTTLNFLPDNHIVVVREEDLSGDFETVLDHLRAVYRGNLPRTVNMISGPSRSADIEQTLVLGAHGPLRLHVIMVRAQSAPAATGAASGT